MICLPSAAVRNSGQLEYLGTVGPLMILIEIFASHSGLRFLLTFLILFPGGKNKKHLRRSSEIADQVIIFNYSQRTCHCTVTVVSQCHSVTESLQTIL